MNQFIQPISSSLSTVQIYVYVLTICWSQRQVRFNLCLNISNRIFGIDSLWMVYMWTKMSLRGFCWFGWTKDFPISGPNWKTNRVREINREIVLISAGLSFLKTYSFYLFCALHLLEKGKKLEFLRLNAMLLTFVRLKKCLIRTIFHADVRYTMCRICTSIFHFPFPAYSIRPANHYRCCAFNLMKFEQNMITYEIPS